MARASVDPTRPSEQDAALARDALDRVKHFLINYPKQAHEPVTVTVEEGGQLTLPRSAVDLLARLLVYMAAGQGVSIVPRHAELTTQQAADLLNVSRPYLIGLLESGKIDFKMVGTHRRIKASSLVEYQRADDAERRKAADELAALTQEMELD